MGERCLGSWASGFWGFRVSELRDFGFRVSGFGFRCFGVSGREYLRPLTLADNSKVVVLGAWYKFVNFEGEGVLALGYSRSSPALSHTVSHCLPYCPALSCTVPRTVSHCFALSSKVRGESTCARPFLWKGAPPAAALEGIAHRVRGPRSGTGEHCACVLSTLRVCLTLVPVCLTTMCLCL